MERVELQEIIVQVNELPQLLSTRQSVQTLLARFHKKTDYEIVVPYELMRQAKDFQRIFTIVLGSIAAISLIVGGIGIMNIMLVSVTKRTREIGVRKAIGARRADILMQFLVESVAVSACGGILGVALGCGVSLCMGRLAGWAVAVQPMTLIVALSFSALVGIVFGLWPARQASCLQPIEALRYEESH